MLSHASAQHAPPCCSLSYVANQGVCAQTAYSRERAHKHTHTKRRTSHSIKTCLVQNAVLNPTHPPTHHIATQGQLGCLIETQALTSLVRGKLPRIYTHLVKELEVTPSDLLGPWVSRCLVGAAGSIQATARCWDCLLFEGPKVLHRVALAILAMSESTILSCAHPMALARLLEGRVKGAAALCGEGVLISAAFRRSLVGSMPGAMLASLRVKAAADVERQLERKRAQLAQIISR